MSAREEILERVKAALKLPAPLPGHASRRMAEAAGPEQSRSWLPVVGESFEQRLEQFRRNLVELRGELEVVEDEDALAERMMELSRREGWSRIGVHRDPLVQRAIQRLALPLCETDKPYAISDLEQCEAGITACDALIAQTGTVLVTSRSAGGRALSVLPAHHVVVATSRQLLPDLPEAFALLKKKYSPNYPSFTSLITGPSRTGDIERILVLGAHGPKKLTILCVSGRQTRMRPNV